MKHISWCVHSRGIASASSLNSNTLMSHAINSSFVHADLVLIYGLFNGFVGTIIWNSVRDTLSCASRFNAYWLKYIRYWSSLHCLIILISYKCAVRVFCYIRHWVVVGVGLFRTNGSEIDQTTLTFRFRSGGHREAIAATETRWLNRILYWLMDGPLSLTL